MLSEWSVACGVWRVACDVAMLVWLSWYSRRRPMTSSPKKSVAGNKLGLVAPYESSLIFGWRGIGK